MTLPTDAGRVLLPLARGALTRAVSGEWAPRDSAGAGPEAVWLGEDGACFVTLHVGTRLRGCIGSLEPYRPLREDVRGNAVAAGTRDPRFPAVTAAELPQIRVEVSVLSPAVPLEFVSQEDAVAQLRPGVDGVVLSRHGRRGTFLPSVWEQLPDRLTFLAHLKRKAGLPESFWDDDIRLARYTTTAWHEE